VGIVVRCKLATGVADAVHMVSQAHVLPACVCWELHVSFFDTVLDGVCFETLCFERTEHFLLLLNVTDDGIFWLGRNRCVADGTWRSMRRAGKGRGGSGSCLRTQRDDVRW
jgi:hypothetical protein